MMNSEIFLFGIGILFSVLLWKYVWIKTHLDDTRDRLFDLRDITLHNYFKNHELGFEHPIYVQLRKLINGHLRHTESLTIWELMFTLNSIKKGSEIDMHMSAVIDRRFFTKEQETKKLIEQVRLESTGILMQYMIFSSVVGVLFFVLHRIISVLSRLTKGSMALIRFYPFKTNAKNRLAMEMFALN